MTPTTSPVGGLTSMSGIFPFLLTMIMGMGFGGGDGGHGHPFLGHAFSYLGMTLLLQYASLAYHLIRGVLQGQTTTAVLRENDPAFNWLRLWLAKQVLKQRNQPIPLWADLLEAVYPTGSTPPRHMELSTLDPDGAVDDNDDAESRDGYRNDSMRSRRGVDEEEEMRLTAYPAHNEPITLNWNGTSYTFTVTASDRKEDTWDMIRISTQSRRQDAFDAIIREARAQHKIKNDTRLDVYVSQGGDGWRHSLTRSARTWDSLILPESIKSAILDDCREFLDARQFYAGRGLPFRRGYLLHGCPGSGKSTTISAIATELKLDVYIVNLNTKRIDDWALSILLSTTPGRSIVVMEDIDCAMSSRVDDDDMKEEENIPGLATSPFSVGGIPRGGASGVSLSGLLNAIDGIASAEGRLLFCTTNYLDRIDPALARPGRCDVWFEFTHADDEQVVAAFKHFYLPLPRIAETIKLSQRADEQSRAPAKPASPDEEEDRTEKEKHIDELARRFAAKVEKEVLTIAQLQGFFLRYRNKPDEVVDAVDDWIASGYEQGAARMVPARQQQAIDDP